MTFLKVICIDSLEYFFVSYVFISMIFLRSSGKPISQMHLVVLYNALLVSTIHKVPYYVITGYFIALHGYTCYSCPASMSRHVAGRRDTGSESLWLM